MADEGVTHNTVNGDAFQSHLDEKEDVPVALNRIRTAGSITISPELFEKMYLSPPNQVKGQLRKTFGNPTPIGLLGFLMTLTPLSMDLMNWRGAATADGAVTLGMYMFFGGMLMTIGGVAEWIVGNTFPCVVFVSFGAYWLGFGIILDPVYEVGAAYNPAHPAKGSLNPAYNAALGHFQLWMGILCLIYLICALRTNLAFVGIFFCLMLTFIFLTAVFYELAAGNTAYASDTLLVGAGACAFGACCFGWWIFTAILLQAVDFPLEVPVGDLSSKFKGLEDRKKAKAH